MYSADEGLVPLERSRLADAIGVSTIAFDQNRKLVLIAQSPLALSSAGRIAPSGSGSLEPVDLAVALRSGTARTAPLCDIIVAGMNRELVEEANLGPGDIRWSAVTGYFRWITRGAKPEYVGVTVLDRRTDELVDHERLTERKWVKAIYRDISVDFDRLRQAPRDVAGCLSERYPHQQLSVPLCVALTALGERLADEEFSTVFFEQFT